MVSFVSLLALMAAGPLSFAVSALAFEWEYPHTSPQAVWYAGQTHHAKWTPPGDGSSSSLILTPAGEGGQSYTLQSNVALDDGIVGFTVPANALPGLYVCYFPNGGYTSPTVVVAVNLP